MPHQSYCKRFKITIWINSNNCPTEIRIFPILNQQHAAFINRIRPKAIDLCDEKYIFSDHRYVLIMSLFDWPN